MKEVYLYSAGELRGENSGVPEANGLALEDIPDGGLFRPRAKAAALRLGGFLNANWGIKVSHGPRRSFRIVTEMQLRSCVHVTCAGMLEGLGERFREDEKPERHQERVENYMKEIFLLNQPAPKGISPKVERMGLSLIIAEPSTCRAVLGFLAKRWGVGLAEGEVMQHGVLYGFRNPQIYSSSKEPNRIDFNNL